MKLYRFREPFDYRFARAVRLGTWYPDPGPGVCPECGTSQQQRIPPLIIEWLPDSDQVGDFTIAGFGDDVLVTQKVREALETRFRGFEFHPVEMYQHPRLKRPQRITKRSKPRVWLPYEGPPLWDLRPTSVAQWDRERSTIEIIKVCGTCGRTDSRMPTDETRHLVLDPNTWGGEDIFWTYEPGGFIYCTEELKEFIEAQGFTNVAFEQDGEIPE
jgi:hypothetical protein